MVLSLQRKVTFGFGLAIVLLAGVAAEAFRALVSARDSAAWVTHTHVVIESLNKIVLDLTGAESAQRAFILTGDRRFLAPFDSDADNIDEHVDSLRALVVDNGSERTRADSLSMLVGGRIERLRTSIAQAKQGSMGAAMTYVLAESDTTFADAPRQLADAMVREEHRLLAVRAETERVKRRYAIGATATAFVIALLTAIVASLAVGRDVRDRERMTRALAETAEREHEANRAKSDFLARMSHELRTPLNSVIGFAGVLAKNKGGRLGEQDLAYVQRIRANGTHLLGLINDILDLSKVESGRMDLEVEPVDVLALVRETVAQFGDAAVPVRIALPATAAPLSSDRVKMKQILLNLIANAVKFTDHGYVLVRVATDADDAIERIDVIDSGGGIPPDRLQAIFEAFEQAESGTSRRFGGTGLGLTIARSMAQRMGFRLEVVSELGVGSTFSILCTPEAPGVLRHEAPTSGERPDAAPLIEPQPAVERQPTIIGRELPDASKPTVLVIDDSADSRLLLSQFLEDDGKHVLTAVSGEQGTRLASDLRPQLIILDLLMPGIDGWETLRRLKADPATCGIPVIVVSIVATEQRGGVLGAVDLVDKPVSREQLLDAVRRNMARQSARVLVVEDRADTRVLFGRFLNDMGGLTVRMASSGRDALRMLDEFTPDIVILDLMLPDIDGLEVLRELRRHPTLGTIPVIVATARSLSAAERSELEQQAHAILNKDGALGDELRTALHGAKPYASSSAENVRDS
jgi:signal transduction histidine kinase/CheY-like chemotaxis protein